MHKKLASAALAAALLTPFVALADTTLTASGSTALLPLVKQAAMQYQTEHEDVKITVSGGGSYVGISQAMANSVDIGDSDVLAPGHSGLKDHRVAVVGFAIVANNADGVKHLSRKQLRDIFSGRISNWKQAGGNDRAITVINRPRSSGTRAVFNATVMGTSKINESGLVQDSSGEVINMVASTPGAISYVALAYTKDKDITLLTVDGVAPTEDNIKRGKYDIWSYEHMFTHAGSSARAEDFIKFVMNDKLVLRKLGYIPVGEMKVKENNR